MRKDGKNSYQALKGKLLEIKEELLDAKESLLINQQKGTLKTEHELNFLYNLYDRIWRIVNK